MTPALRQRTLRRRLVIAVASAAGVLLAGWLVVRYVVVPWALRRALATAGLAPAAFEIRSVGLTRLRIADLSVGAAPWLTVDDLEVAYSLRDLASGRIEAINASDAVWTVRVRDGAIDWGISLAPSSGPPAIDLPFQRAAITKSVIRIDMVERTYDVDAHLTLNSSAAGLSGELGLAGLGGDIDLALSASPEAGVGIALEMATTRPAVLNSESSGVSSVLNLISAHAKIGRDGSGAPTLAGTVRVRGGNLHVGDTVFTDLDADIGVRSLDEIALEGFTTVLGDGGTLSIEPFSLDRAAPTVRTRIIASNLSLGEWLPVLTDQRATGQGRVGGSVDIAIDLSGDAPRLIELAGNLAADPPHGFVQVTDADALGALLDAQNPRFATDDVMRPLRERIVDALRDFAFGQFTVDLSRDGNFTVARAYISGSGRHGEDPQGLNLTLDLHVQDALLDLASRIESFARVKAAARGALQEFFGAQHSGGGRP